MLLKGIGAHVSGGVAYDEGKLMVNTYCVSVIPARAGQVRRLAIVPQSENRMQVAFARVIHFFPNAAIRHCLAGTHMTRDVCIRTTSILTRNETE